MTDAERAARTRQRLAETLALLAEDPDDPELLALARRLTDVVRGYALVAAIHRAALRWALFRDAEERSN